MEFIRTCDQSTEENIILRSVTWCLQVNNGDVTCSQRVYLRDLRKNDITKGMEIQVCDLASSFNVLLRSCLGPGKSLT